MIKLHYTFRTVGPLHTGSDVNAGTMRTLRRQKCILADPVVYTSRLTDEQRRDAVLQVAFGVWRTIDWKQIKGARLMGIWDEFANKMLAAARESSKYKFLEKLCRLWGIESITDRNVLAAIDALSDYELIDTVRNELMYIMLKMRTVRDSAKEAKKEAETAEGFFDFSKEKETKVQFFDPLSIELGEEREIQRIDDEIPCISGNSIRGKIRRLLMYDFCQRTNIKRLDKRVYHTLFTGGFLDQSTKYEDLDKMDLLITKCPAIGLLGSAVGNMTIEGEMKIGWAYPLCRERGTGEKSYWEYLDTVFQTRHDSSKIDKEFELTGEDQTQQMKYEYEVFADGTPFEHRIVCTSHDPLLLSCFSHALKLFKENPYIGGMGSVGNGEIAIEWDDAQLGSSDEYCQYIDSNNEDIKEFWENATV